MRAPQGRGEILDPDFIRSPSRRLETLRRLDRACPPTGRRGGRLDNACPPTGGASRGELKPRCFHRVHAALEGEGTAFQRGEEAAHWFTAMEPLPRQRTARSSRPHTYPAMASTGGHAITGMFPVAPGGFKPDRAGYTMPPIRSTP